MDSLTITRLGLRKVAILLIQLGEQRSAAILSHLTDTEVEAITAEIARIEQVNVKNEESEAVLREFLDIARERRNILNGGLGFAHQVLEGAVGPDKAGAIFSRLEAQAMQMPFSFLHRADPDQLRAFLMEEHPQVIAMVLAHMTPDKSSLLLGGLPPAVQGDVAHRIAKMDRTLPEIARAVEQTLERRLASMLQPTEQSRVGGVDPLVNIINRSDRSTERQIVEGLADLDPELAEIVRSKMFTFEDIILLEDRDLQKVLRQVPTAQLPYALKGVPENVRQKVLSNISERSANDLVDEMEVLGTVRAKQVEEAQQAFIAVIRQLEESGDIILRRGGNDDEFIS